ncbi:hypothetical protein DSO57_1025890 [Entomophthora muscae]|uniref:Uncharacterized protein n=1 Tax=Entomophthora muscae TaxID=34485 RepID=A0ACC2UD15_9FUNG|nr:hypothetical protein DSO57_1025890 [Entomophthora muscae]
MPVLCLHFQANANAYPSDTKKVLGVAAMLSEDVLDWFRKATAGNSAHVDTKNIDSDHVNTFNVNTIVK